MATSSDNDPYQGLIPIKMVRGDLISSEFLLEKYLDKAEAVIKEVGPINGIDRHHLRNCTYQENVLAEHLYSTLLTDTPSKDVLKQPPKTLEETVFGPTLYYTAEDTTKVYGTEYHLKTYIDLEINKHFGMSLIEYLNLSVYELEMVNRVAREYIDALRAYREKEEKNVSTTEKNLLKEFKP